MSERKTTEIKLRVTPVEKAAWQLAAEDEGVGLSELIRREMNDWAAQRRPADGASEFISTNAGSTPGWGDLLAPLADSDTGGEDSPIAPTSAVPTSDDESRVAKPWMFEARASD